MAPRLLEKYEQEILPALVEMVLEHHLRLGIDQKLRTQAGVEPVEVRQLTRGQGFKVVEPSISFRADQPVGLGELFKTVGPLLLVDLYDLHSAFAFIVGW